MGYIYYTISLKYINWVRNIVVFRLIPLGMLQLSAEENSFRRGNPLITKNNGQAKIWRKNCERRANESLNIFSVKRTQALHSYFNNSILVIQYPRYLKGVFPFVLIYLS